jgi:hypothetical protein
MYLKLLENQEQTKPQISRWSEIIKIRAEINELETKQTTQRINETKNCFFEKVNKINKPLANMTKWRNKKTQINKTSNKKGDITTNINEIQRIIRKCLENLHSNKLENLDEMSKFLDAYNQPKLNQEDIKHINHSITCNEIEAVIVFLQRRTQDLMDSWLNFTKPLKKN